MAAMKEVIEQLDKRPNTAMKTLLKMPPRRNCVLRPNKKPPNLLRIGNLEAMLINITGEAPPEPCSRCSTGFGRFHGCFRVENMRYGACGNCHYNDGDKCCNLRTKAETPRVFKAQRKQPLPTKTKSTAHRPLKRVYPSEAEEARARPLQAAPPPKRYKTQGNGVSPLRVPVDTTVAVTLPAGITPAELDQAVGVLRNAAATVQSLSGPRQVHQQVYDVINNYADALEYD